LKTKTRVETLGKQETDEIDNYADAAKGDQVDGKEEKLEYGLDENVKKR